MKPALVGTSILLLSVIIASTPALTFAELKKDNTGKIYVVKNNDRAGTPARAIEFQPAKDPAYKDTIQSDNFFRKRYMDIVNEGICCVQQGQYEQAVEKCNAAIKIEPGLPYAYVNLADACCGLKRYKEAKDNYKKAEEIFRGTGNSEGIRKVEESLALITQ